MHLELECLLPLQFRVRQHVRAFHDLIGPCVFSSPLVGVAMVCLRWFSDSSVFRL